MAWARQKRTNKYHAHKVKDDGHTFDSKAEYARYCELKLMQLAGEIRGLEVHPRFPLVVNGYKIGRGYMVPDFRYVRGEQEVVEDVKGMTTESWPTRRDLLLALYPSIELAIIHNKKRIVQKRKVAK